MLGCNPALTGQRYRNPDAALVLWLHYLVFSCIDNLVFTPRCAIFVLLFGGDARVVMCRVALAYSRFQPISGSQPFPANDRSYPRAEGRFRSSRLRLSYLPVIRWLAKSLGTKTIGFSSVFEEVDLGHIWLHRVQNDPNFRIFGPILSPEFPPIAASIAARCIPLSAPLIHRE